MYKGKLEVIECICEVGVLAGPWRKDLPECLLEEAGAALLQQEHYFDLGVMSVQSHWRGAMELSGGPWALA